MKEYFVPIIGFLMFFCVVLYQATVWSYLLIFDVGEGKELKTEAVLFYSADLNKLENAIKKFEKLEEARPNEKLSYRGFFKTSNKDVVSIEAGKKTAIDLYDAEKQIFDF